MTTCQTWHKGKARAGVAGLEMNVLRPKHLLR